MNYRLQFKANLRDKTQEPGAKTILGNANQSCFLSLISWFYLLSV